MAHGGVVVLVSWLVSMCSPLLAMPQILGDVGMLVPVHLGVLAVGVGHDTPPPALALPACQNPTQIAGPASPRLTAKLTAKPHDTRGPQGMTMDAYTSPELGRCDWR
jgi:hypothetical protein